MDKEYALYRGETFICIGTIKEIAKHQGVEVNSISYLKTGAYKRRIEKRKKGFEGNVQMLICLDD